jgi:uncharacterized protein (TIRG00374 family)
MIGVVVLVVLILYMDLQQLGPILWGAHIGLLVVSFSMKVVAMWLKSARWAFTLRVATGRPVRRAFSASMMGFAGNIILPARLGELIRASMMDKYNQTSLPLALTTIGITQLLDLLALAGYFLILSMWVTSLFMKYRIIVSLLGIGLVCALGGLIVLQLKAQSLRALVLPMSKKLPNTFNRLMTQYVALFLQGIGILSQRVAMGWALLLTIAVWGLETWATYLMLQGFHIRPTVLMAAVLMVVLNLSFVFPITPGNLGVAQAITVFLLSTFGVTQEAALAYSIGSESLAYLIIIGLGMVCFYQEKLQFNLFRHTTPEESSKKQMPDPTVKLPL